MDFTVTTANGDEEAFTGEARYSIENGVLTVYTGDAKLTYSPMAWAKVTEATGQRSKFATF